ncbi:ABC transporter permease [Flavitalea sp. BT771]|uniref:ABC transporter permease n=1 Tax=Flavitalea sp. BT771 TaxID=3063329 RepID=UPI0026E1D0D8|nr:ABC transporter permease [Flavitalea sp. BT771]MDO6431828.1 ABC transporter permease [Flavitalea sp. BT771]MDV6220737.1 ABC transporter permease [Flavitalea sp. BT771]
MLRNYLKIALRNMAKHKVISFINLFGLTVGISCCLLIVTYIIHEVSYDKYNSKADRIYRVTRSFNNKEGITSLHLGSVAPPFGPLLQNEFPDIEKVTRIFPVGTVPTRYEEKIFNEKDLYYADENLFGIFDVTLLKGNPRTALTDPYSVILTEDIAKRYFGNDDPINKVIRLNNQYNFKVTGIFKPFPDAAHLHPRMMLSFATLKDTAIYGERALQTNWGNNSFFTYLLLPPNYPVKNIEARFPAFLDKYMGQPGDSKPSSWTKLYIQRLTDIHLTSHLDAELEDNGDIKRVYIFSAIALFILLIACINYMNLSTARSALRAKEIGIRKTSGAQRNEIIIQFLSESVVITALATVLAIGVTWLTLPALNGVIDQSLSIRSLFTLKVIIPLLLTPFVVGILSGIYPALFMSSFKPVQVLKGLFKAGNGSISFRKVLVVTQFSISIILIICTAIVFQQLHFMQDKSLGFDKERIVTIGYDRSLGNTYNAFRNELRSSTYIRDAGRSSRIPSGRLLDEQGASTESGDSLRPVSADIKYVTADFDFVPTYGMSVIAGRNFSRDYATDSSSFILNAAATRALGVQRPEQAVGHNFEYGGIKGKIVGVLGDFHFESMHQQIVPLVLVMAPDNNNAGFHLNWLSVKIAGNNINGGLAHLEKTWKKYLPQTPFEYTFLDEKFQQLYRSEQRQGTLFTSFSGIAIFIACLGLLGLSAFAISQRIKEIGVRKVLGASTTSIVSLLSKDFLKLVAIGALIAFPVAWYAMHNWLSDFAYRISIQWWIFLVAGILASAVALITIGFQAIRAAMSPPVKSLRTE